MAIGHLADAFLLHRWSSVEDLAPARAGFLLLSVFSDDDLAHLLKHRLLVAIALVSKGVSKSVLEVRRRRRAVVRRVLLVLVRRLINLEHIVAARAPGEVIATIGRVTALVVRVGLLVVELRLDELRLSQSLEGTLLLISPGNFSLGFGEGSRS